MLSKYISAKPHISYNQTFDYVQHFYLLGLNFLKSPRCAALFRLRHLVRVRKSSWFDLKYLFWLNSRFWSPKKSTEISAGLLKKRKKKKNTGFEHNKNCSHPQVTSKISSDVTWSTDGCLYFQKHKVKEKRKRQRDLSQKKGVIQSCGGG